MYIPRTTFRPAWKKSQTGLRKISGQPGSTLWSVDSDLRRPDQGGTDTVACAAVARPVGSVGKRTRRAHGSRGWWKSVERRAEVWSDGVRPLFSYNIFVHHPMGFTPRLQDFATPLRHVYSVSPDPPIQGYRLICDQLIIVIHSQVFKKVKIIVTFVHNNH